MDELVIEDKKYISSKRAADITGYAKDYVGQLAREGYVDARRVGRNWYVLESAIRDHRFGNPAESGLQGPRQEVKSETHSVTNTWEAPRYMPADAEPPLLPSINRLGSDPEPIFERIKPAGEARDSSRPPEDLQDTWQAWFDTFHQPGAPVVESREIRLEETKTPATETQDEPLQVEEIPIHVLRDIPKPQPSREARPIAVPRLSLEKRPPPPAPPRFIRAALVSALLFTASALAITAVLESGYFDASIPSYIQADAISGISIYNK